MTFSGFFAKLFVVAMYMAKHIGKGIISMSAETKSEILTKLRKAQDELIAINVLELELEETHKYLQDIYVSRKKYDTTTAKALLRERQDRIYEEQANVKNHSWLVWCIFAVSLILSFLSGNWLIAYLIFYLGIPACIITVIIGKKKKNAKKEKIALRLTQAYASKIEAAERADKAAEVAYQKAVDSERAKRTAEVQPKLDNIEHQLRLHRQNFMNLNVLSFNDVDEDPELLSKMLRLIESGRADSVKECYQLIDEEKYRQEEEKRREEERKRNSPGKIYVYVGEPRSGKVPRNEITIDGQSYGPGTIPYKEIVLQPGWHTICVAIQYISDTIYRSDAFQFELEGCGEKYYQFFIESPHRGVEIKECASRSDLSRHP